MKIADGSPEFEFELELGRERFQSSSKRAPKNEFRPAFARVVDVVSKILPPTLNVTLSLSLWLGVPIFDFVI